MERLIDVFCLENTCLRPFGDLPRPLGNLMEVFYLQKICKCKAICVSIPQWIDLIKDFFLEKSFRWPFPVAKSCCSELVEVFLFWRRPLG